MANNKLPELSDDEISEAKSSETLPELSAEEISAAPNLTINNRFLPEYSPKEELTPEDIEYIKSHPNEALISKKLELPIPEDYAKQVSELQIPYNQASAAVAGGLQGATLGASDEVLAALEAGGKKLSDKDTDLIKSYYDYKAKIDAQHKKLKEMYPGTYTTSEIAAGLAVPLPKFGTASKATSALKSLSKEAALAEKSAESSEKIKNFIKSLSTNTGLGGAVGATTSEGKLLGTPEEQEKLKSDIKLGAGLGAGLTTLGTAGSYAFNRLSEAPIIDTFKDAYKFSKRTGLSVGDKETQEILSKDLIEKANRYAEKLQEENATIAKKIKSIESNGKKINTEDVLSLADDTINELSSKSSLSATQESELKALQSLKEDMISEIRNVPTISTLDETPKLLERLKTESELKRNQAEKEGRELIGGDIQTSTLPSGKKTAGYSLHEKTPISEDQLSTLSDEDVLKQYTQLSSPEVGGFDYKKIAGKDIILPEPTVKEDVQQIRIPKEIPSLTAEQSRKLEKMLYETGTGKTGEIAGKLKETRKKGLGEDYEALLEKSNKWLSALESLGVPKEKIREISENPDLKQKLADLVTSKEGMIEKSPIKAAGLEETAKAIEQVSSPELNQAAKGLTQSVNEYEELRKLNKNLDAVSPSFYGSDAAARVGVRVGEGVLGKLGSELGAGSKAISDFTKEQLKKLPKSVQESLSSSSGTVKKTLSPIKAKISEQGLAGTARLGQISNANDIQSQDISDPAKLSRNVSSADDKTLYEISEKLKGTAFENDAFELQKALLNGDHFKAKALQNKLIQNKDARALIEGM